MSYTFKDSFLEENNIIFKKYKPIKVIGIGAFSKIYSAIRISDKAVFAIKTEKKSAFKNHLKNEAYNLLTLRDGIGIPKLISYGNNKKYEILIETLLDKSLKDIFIEQKKPCNLIDLCLIAIQSIERLEFIHYKDLIYRDVKPENIMIGLKDPNIIYIIDFGLCQKYRSSKTGKHIQFKETKKFNGTLIYASSYVLQGKESSRRDDLISLAYTLIFLYKRNLPWESNWDKLNKIKYLHIINSKETFDFGQLLVNLPKEMIDFLKYTQNLRFEQDPDYAYMKGCFQNILAKMNLNMNKINFSWINPNDKKYSQKKNSTGRRPFRKRLIKMLEYNSASKDKNKEHHFTGSSVITNDNIINQKISHNNNYLIRKNKKISNTKNNNIKNKTDNKFKPNYHLITFNNNIIKKINNTRNTFNLNKKMYTRSSNNSLIKLNNITQINNNQNKKVAQNVYINNNRNIFVNNINLNRLSKNIKNLNTNYNKKFGVRNKISDSIINKVVNPKVLLKNYNTRKSNIRIPNLSETNNKTINSFINRPKIYKSKILKINTNLNTITPNLNKY